MTDGRGLEIFPDPTEWLTVDRAAELTRQSMRTWRWRAQREATEAQRCARRPLARKVAPPDGKGRAIWHVHRSLDGCSSRCPNRQARDNQRSEALIATHPAHIVERALKCNHWLQRWRKACQTCAERNLTDRRLAERVVAEARRVEGPGFSSSVRSLTRWWRCYNRVGEDGQIRAIEGLIDRRPSAEERSNDRATRSPEAVGYFYDLYHTQNRLSVKICHGTTLREARRRDWRWPRGCTATLSWLKKHDDLSLTCLMREGRTVWARKYLPHLEIDYTRVQPGEIFVAGDPKGTT